MAFWCEVWVHAAVAAGRARCASRIGRLTSAAPRASTMSMRTRPSHSCRWFGTRCRPGRHPEAAHLVRQHHDAEQHGHVGRAKHLGDQPGRGGTVDRNVMPMTAAKISTTAGVLGQTGRSAPPGHAPYTAVTAATSCASAPAQPMPRLPTMLNSPITASDQPLTSPPARRLQSGSSA